MGKVLLGFMILLVAIVASRILGARAVRTLSEEEKAALTDLYATRQPLYLLVLFGGTIGFLIIILYEILPPLPTMAVFSLVILSMAGLNTWRIYRRLADGFFDPLFIRRFLGSLLIRLAGLTLMLILVLSELTGR